jgi:hypothetical protein
MKPTAIRRIAFFFMFVLLLSSTGFCAPLSMFTEQDKQSIMQQSTFQPPENAKVNDIWLEPSDLAMETKTIQASINEYLRIVLVSPPNKSREWQYVDEKPRFLENLHSQVIAVPSAIPQGERQTVSLFIFKVQYNASGGDRLTFVQYQITNGEKTSVSMLDLGVRYFDPQIRAPL